MLLRLANLDTIEGRFSLATLSLPLCRAECYETQWDTTRYKHSFFPKWSLASRIYKLSLVSA